MTQEQAIQIATSFIEKQWKRRVELIGVREPSKKESEWTVLFKTILPGGAADEVVDGPTVVLVDPRSLSARFLISM
jgi:C-terminal processing protease CtpA/Prc